MMHGKGLDITHCHPCEMDLLDEVQAFLDQIYEAATVNPENVPKTLDEGRALMKSIDARGSSCSPSRYRKYVQPVTALLGGILSKPNDQALAELETFIAF